MADSEEPLELRSERWLVCSSRVYDAIRTSWAPRTAEASLLQLRLREGLVELIESPEDLRARVAELDRGGRCVVRVAVEQMNDALVELLDSIRYGSADLRLHVWREAPLEVLDALNTPDDAVLDLWRKWGRAPKLRHLDPLLEPTWAGEYERALKQWESDARADHGNEAFEALYCAAAENAKPPANNVLSFAPRKPPASRTHNLPVQSTSFVGRVEERQEVKRLLHASRLVTLTGTGGAGKTRLALQVGAEVVDEFPDGVWFVEPAPLAHERLVPQTVATALGVKEQPGMSMTEAVIKEAKDKKLLLVLDNCEHLLQESAALCEALLAACANVRIMASSREMLRVPGETAYRVPSLPTPDSKRIVPVASITEYAAVELFIDRARTVKQSFAANEANAQAIASICRCLDGIPLAIELAAAAVRSLSVEEIDRQLNARFEILTRRSHAVLPRRETLRSLIDWSYDALGAAEQRLLCRLAVFAGGWNVTAVEAICSDQSVHVRAVRDLLNSLVDKHLVRIEGRDGAIRYRLLETVRQYARERLQGFGEETQWQGRHLAYFLALAGEAEPQLRGEHQQAWLDRLASEYDNLRSALTWSSTTAGDAVAGLRLAGALGWFWYVRGYYGEGRYWLSKLLGATSDEQTAARANALHGAGMLTWRQGDYSGARPLYEEALAIYKALDDGPHAASSLDRLGTLAFEQGQIPAARKFYGDALAIFRELGDRRGIAVVLSNLGAVTLTQCNYRPAEVLLEESLAIFRELDDKRAIANALNNLGVAACEQGKYASARTLYDECLEAYRVLGDPWGVASMLTNLGEVAFLEGDYSAARSLLMESLPAVRELGNRLGIAASLNYLGSVAYHQGNYAQAVAWHEGSLVIRSELEDRRGIASSLEGLAYVAFSTGKPRRAACIWGGAERLREEIASPMPPSTRAHYDHQVAAARGALADGTDFDRAWQEGRAMALERAIEYALEKQES